MKQAILIVFAPFILGGCLAGSQYQIPPDAYARCHRVDGFITAGVGSGAYADVAVTGDGQAAGVAIYGDIPPEAITELVKTCPQLVGSSQASPTK